jgi:antitoxin component of MazEF toxin-antitoxin module
MQVAGGIAYVVIPIELVDTLGLEQSDEIQRGYHAESDCLVMNLRREQNLFRLD